MNNMIFEYKLFELIWGLIAGLVIFGAGLIYYIYLKIKEKRRKKWKIN